jgi:hypothetical protein
MNDLMLKTFAKSLKPYIAPSADKGETALIQYLSQIPLNENETDAIVILDRNSKNELLILVVAVQGREIVRKIHQFTKEQIIDFVLKSL